MTGGEIALAKKMYAEGCECSDIAETLGRNHATITRHVIQRSPRKPQGRQKTITPAILDRLEARLNEMINKANGEYEVTVGMLERSCRLKVCKRTILDALHTRGIYFRPLRQKPTLTPEDIEERKAFADQFACKSAAWWRKAIHMHIDVKHFQVLPHGRARAHAAQERTRGTYRKRAQGLGQWDTKPILKTKFNTGAKGVKVLAGIGNGKVLMWKYLEGPWGGKAAEDAYSGPVATALQTEYPGRRSFTVLEDNDPSGFKSGPGRAAKESAGIKSFDIPKRSPCLNVCDYFLWSAINRSMREQEKKFSKTKRETRAAFLRRLRRTALSLPSEALNAAVGDMKRRCARLQSAAGRNIEEGGKARRAA